MFKLFFIFFYFFTFLKVACNDYPTSYQKFRENSSMAFSNCIQNKSQLPLSEKKRIITAIKQKEDGNDLSSKFFKDTLIKAGLNDTIIIFKTTLNMMGYISHPQVYEDIHSGKKIEYRVIYTHEDYPLEYKKVINAHEIGHLICLNNQIPQELSTAKTNSLSETIKCQGVSQACALAAIVGTVLAPSFMLLLTAAPVIVLGAIASNYHYSQWKKHSHKEELFCDSFAALSTGHGEVLVNFFKDSLKYIKDANVDSMIDKAKDLCTPPSLLLSILMGPTLYSDIINSVHPDESERIKNLQNLQIEINKHNGKIDNPIAFAFEWVNKRYPTA